MPCEPDVNRYSAIGRHRCHIRRQQIFTVVMRPRSLSAFTFQFSFHGLIARPAHPLPKGRSHTP